MYNYNNNYIGETKKINNKFKKNQHVHVQIQIHVPKKKEQNRIKIKVKFTDHKKQLHYVESSEFTF